MADYLCGCDISHHDGAVDFYTMYRRGLRFVFIKASQGLRKDSAFCRNWLGAREAGLLRGAYHFLDWSASAEKQAEFFLATLGDDIGELPPVVDYELEPPARDAIKRLAKFVEIVEHEVGGIIIYTSWGYWNLAGSRDDAWARYPLWIAHYTMGAQPRLPLPWQKWTFWQYTANGDGRYFGTQSRSLDLNYFDGNLDALVAFSLSWRRRDEHGLVTVEATPKHIAPRSDSNRVGIMPAGVRVRPTSVSVESSHRVWVLVSHGGISVWIPAVYDGKQYLTDV